MRWLLTAVCAALGLVLVHSAHAQTGNIPEGALDLIRATGARSVGMGQAMVAAASGSEAMWWNPALLARSTRDAHLDVRNKANAVDVETDAAVAMAVPVRNLGAFGFSFRYFNDGTQAVTQSGGQQVGSLDNTTMILGASFASTFSNWVAIGFTFKELLQRQPCTGDCTQAGADVSSSQSGSALDFGGHLFLMRDSSLSIGAAVRNLGPRFQIKDAEQADPLPGRGEVGILYSPRLQQFPEIRARAAADVVSRTNGGTALGFRFGGEVTYQERYALRAGYIVKGPGEETTPTVGFGIATGRLRIDLAQIMSDLGIQGSRPTFLSLSYKF